MPRNDELSRLPFRLPQNNNRLTLPKKRPATDAEWADVVNAFQEYAQQEAKYKSDLALVMQNLVGNMANINLKSGLTKFSDSVNKGYFLGFTRNDTGYSDGMPVFVVGDRGNEKYFSFDGDDLNIGTQTQFPGTDTYNNEEYFLHTFFESLDGYFTIPAGGGSVDYSAANVQLLVGGNSGDGATLSYSPGYPIKRRDGSWAGRYRFKTRINANFGSASNVTFIMCMGHPSGGAVGFKLVNGPTLQGFVIANGVEVDTVTLGTYFDTSQNHLLEAVKEASGGASFYVDGELMGESSESPAGSPTAIETPILLNLRNTAAGSSESVELSEWMFCSG